MQLFPPDLAPSGPGPALGLGLGGRDWKSSFPEGAKAAPPDMPGGSHDQMSRLTAARAAARKARGGASSKR